jgi:fructose-1,6-bisphosphatase/inositol monophosphatase family enzyme
MVEIQDLADTCHLALRLASEVIVADRFRQVATQTKEGLDVVTSTDLSAERIILETIKGRFPEHAIVTEESENENESSPYLWIVDPLDGTVNFRSGLPLFNVSIAVQFEGRTMVGGVSLPALGETYFAMRGTGAFSGQRRLRIADTSLSEAVLSIILTSHFSPRHTDQTISLIRTLSPLARGIRVIVSEALELSYVAAGMLSGNMCVKADAFGAAAGQLIIEEAGGTVSDMKGRPFTNESTSILASNGYIHEDLLRVIESLF